MIYPHFRSVLADSGETDFKLDVVVEASGFGRREMQIVEEVILVLIDTGDIVDFPYSVYGIGSGSPRTS